MTEQKKCPECGERTQRVVTEPEPVKVDGGRVTLRMAEVGEARCTNEECNAQWDPEWDHTQPVPLEAPPSAPASDGNPADGAASA